MDLDAYLNERRVLVDRMLDTGRPLLTVAEMAEEAKQRLGDAQRELHQHIGDFTLFWAGVYPEALRRSSSCGAVDQFEDYCAHGKRSYLIASTIKTDQQERASADVLQRLSDRFELCTYGLREVRREWEEGDDENFGPGAILLN